ncbi:MAG: outer membrane beta-barrel protein [Alphaproteobacteria bacterium]|nr:outer membrane beta-barrel protein [Alphaproteobacteria bacterium]
MRKQAPKQRGRKIAKRSRKRSGGALKRRRSAAPSLAPQCFEALRSACAAATRRALHAGSAFAALALAIGASQAWAQAPSADRGSNADAAVMDRTPAGYAAKGVPLGAFRVFPAFTAEVSTIDNVFATDGNEQSDIVYTARPSVEVRSNWSRHSLTFNADLARSFHVDFPKDDITAAQLGVNGALDVRYGTRIGGAAQWRTGAEGRGSPNSPATAIKPIEFEGARVSAFATQTFNRVRVSLQASRDELDFEDGLSSTGVVIDQDDRDRTETAGSARVEVGVTPAIAVLAEVRLGQRDYDMRPANPALVRDSNGRAYLVGVNFDVTRLIRGQVAAGYFSQDYDAQSADSEGLAIDTSFEWFPTRLTTVTVNANRRSDDSGVPGAASILLTSAGVRADHELRRNIVISAGVNSDRREFRGVDREDEVWSGQLSARWQLNPRVALSGGYTHERQDSSGTARDRDFTVNRAFAALTLRL